MSDIPNDFLEQLHNLYVSMREEKRSEWKRDLPFSELLFDRWERAEALKFGSGASIYHSSLVYGDVEVGEKTWVGPHTLLDGTGGLKIGSFCSVSAGVQIYTHDSVKWALSGGKAGYESAPVVVGDFCYIGPQTVIRSGVTIGSHCVIGSCSFVNRDVPDNTIAMGTPCRPYGKVEVDANGNVSLVYETNRSNHE